MNSIYRLLTTAMKLCFSLFFASRFLFVSSESPALRALEGDGHDHDDHDLEDCKTHSIDFILNKGNANLISVEDNIREHLEHVGFDVTAKYLTKEEFNLAEQQGDFHLSFSETWGAPYDPHAYANGWIAGDEGHQQALKNLEAPASRELLFDQINDVMFISSHKEREAKWEEIHEMIHKQAIMLPLWGKRIPTILNKRLVGYVAGSQQFDYPVQHLKILSGSKTVTISPGAQGGLFKSVGRLDPHSYRPNEFFSNNWVYEGLVSYGDQGQVIPALAESWTVADTPGADGQTYTFTLRSGVTFHDGAAWNCAAAKQNFDHVLAEPLRTADYHGWYGLVQEVSEWSCSSDTEFVVKTKSKYYPFLQELSFIRPLRMLSPNAFVGTPLDGNSCPKGWGVITEGDVTVNCAGISDIYGTGPFALSDRTTVEKDGEDVDTEVIFLRNNNYWGDLPDIETLRIVYYDSALKVKEALLDGTLDIVWGAGVLQAATISNFEEDEMIDRFSVFHSGIIQHTILLLNSGKAPLDDINVRKALIHAIDKKEIIKLELGEDTRTVDSVFPLDAPYCDVEFTPKWDFDLEKAELLNCPEGSDAGLAIGLGVGLGVTVPLLAVASIYWYRRSQQYKVELDSLKKNEEGFSA